VRARTTREVAALICVALALLVPAAPAIADRYRDRQWHLRFLNVAEAHKYSQGDGVTVAVIDTGVDPHPDLRNNLLAGTDMVPGGTGDGRQDIVGHGTAMAGTIAAHGRGPNGILGIAPKAKILPVRDQIQRNSGTGTNLGRGIEWAVANGAKVINISQAADAAPRLLEALKAAARADVVVVAAAGNRPGDLFMPAPARLDGVVAVGATGPDGKRAPVSVTGERLAIVAPGVDIWSTGSGGRYFDGAAGTSPATAIVSGAAALVRSKYPELSAPEVVHRLTTTATDKGPKGRDPEYGYGVLNLVAALTADVPPLRPGSSPTHSTPPSAPSTRAAPSTPTAVGPDRGAVLALVTLALLLAAGSIAAVVMVRSRARGGTIDPNL
jgi:type VII secretion-associated serine protease mycosin